MAFLYFPGKTVQWLTAKLDDIVEQLAAGKIAIAGNSADVGATFAIQQSLEETKRKLIYDLSIQDVNTDWAQHLQTRQTRIVFADRFP